MTFQAHKKNVLLDKLTTIQEIPKSRGLKKVVTKPVRLQEICLDILMRETPEGQTLVEQCMLRVARESPADFLRFAIKLLPKEVLAEARLTSPIVIVNTNIAAGPLIANRNLITVAGDD